MIALLLSLIAGALLPFSFAPFNIYSFAFISLAVLLYGWLKATPARALLQGWLFGLGYFGIGISWVYISIHQYGKAPAALAGFITLLLILVMSLYPATLGYVFRKLGQRKSVTIQCLCLFPALWVVWEFFRAYLLSGFPWILVGYSQLTSPLHGLAPLFGVYGLSLATTLISGCLVLVAQRNGYGTKIGCVIIIAILVLVGWFYSGRSWTKPMSDKLKVSLIQGNIQQTIKWQPNRVPSILNTYLKLTKQHWKSRLIVWPEAAIPTFPQQLASFIQQLRADAKQHGSTILTGIPLSNAAGNRYYNGLILIGSDQGQYAKRHLVPFGEYVPFPTIFNALFAGFNFPMSDFSKGPSKQPMISIGQLKLAPFICYEIIFPLEVLDSVKGKNLIVTISDDSWFGKSIALAQHMQMAQMRALETGRYELLGTNSGITAFINPFGQIIKAAAIDKRSVITDTIRGMQGNTPLMNWKYYPVAGMLLLLLLIATFRKQQP